ncbi:muts domain V-domain-containing protein [Catenaria anguillulae PL171]|uniref:DNA mismatch repair protein MSH3 n=1 Tax=Catenaria anguillulae PL171 TaxID=765915 RepID=A0A1Y2HBW8_9FUNG|nr:muts domain V-domain-containing protein [Catenaria anguillulae PL171]
MPASTRRQRSTVASSRRAAIVIHDSDSDPSALSDNDDASESDDDFIVPDDDDDHDKPRPSSRRSASSASSKDKGKGKSKLKSGSTATPSPRAATKSPRPAAASKASTGKGKAASAAAAVGPSGQKYTPLELQIVQLKEQHPGVVLAVEVGYKYRFFGIASNLLQIVAWHDRNFLTASVPVPRIHLHIRRLVRAGHKVGLVQQTETAALKAAGSNARTPFTRQVTRVYTQATLIDELGDDEVDDEHVAGGGLAYIMVLRSSEIKGDNLVAVSMAVVDASTADVVVDEWTDPAGGMMLELEARMTALQPVEIVLAGTMPALVRAWIDRYVKCAPRAIRLEVVDVPEASSVAQELVTQLAQTNSGLLAATLDVSPALQTTIAATLTYLAQFQLHDLPLTLHHFSKSHTFRLSATALRALDIFPLGSSTSPTSTPSLFSILNQTATPPGARQLRRWLARPLMHAALIAQRADAVDMFASLPLGTMADVIKQVKRLGDAEKVLAKLHLARIRPGALWSFLDAWGGVCDKLEAFVDEVGEDEVSGLVRECVAAVVGVREKVEGFKASMDRVAAGKGEVGAMWVQADEVGAIKTELAAVVKEIERTVKQEAAGVQGTVTTCAGVQHLIQVPKARKVPASWTRVSATKQVVRYHTPTLLDLFKQRDVLQETLAKESKALYEKRLRAFSETAFADLSAAVRRLADLDCLMALGLVGRNPGYVRPTLVEEANVLRVVDGRHPVLETMVKYVPNSVDMSQHGQRCLILSGPNMAGKSSIVRQLALTIIMAQIGSRVPASSATLGVFDGIHTRMGASDDLTHGLSTFMVELSETQQCLSQATPRSLVILDELGRGTATHDGTAIAWAVLHHLIVETQCLTLFVTHFPPLADMCEQVPKHVQCAHMGFVKLGAGGDDASDGGRTRIGFMYRLVPGVAGASFGLNVARMAGLPDDLLDLAEVKSREVVVERSDEEKEVCSLVRELERVMKVADE